MIDAQLSMNLFDAIVLGVLFLSALISFFRGFIRELLSLLAWVGAAFITLYLVVDVAEYLEPYVKKPMVAAIFATLGTYFVALMTISLLSSIIVRYLKTGEDVGATDNLLGLFFGVIKGSLIVALGYFLLSVVLGANKEEYPDWVKTAYTLPAVEKGTRIVVAMMPAYLKDITDYAQKDEAQFDLENSLEDGPKQGDAGEGHGYDVKDMQQLQEILQGVQEGASEQREEEGSGNGEPAF